MASIELKANLSIMLSNLLATLRCKSKFFSKQLRLKWKVELLIKIKTCIKRLIFNLTKHPLCDLGQCCHYIQTRLLLYGGNWWDGFYTMATLDWNRLILTTIFSIYYFLLSWRKPFSLSVQPNQTYFSQKHKTQNANWKFGH